MTHLSTELEARAGGYFRRYRFPDWLREHSVLVGRIATLIASAVPDAGAEAVGLAAYLHDIGRSPLVEGDPREHGELAALILSAEGLVAAVEPARRHPVYAVLDPATAPRALAERIVHYADRRGGMKVLSLEDRISETAKRHPRYASDIERSRPRAREIERELFERLPFRPQDLAPLVAAQWP